MSTTFDRIAGQSIQRLSALSDGIFAVAMTLLVLDLHTPVKDVVRSEAALWSALASMAPQLSTYLMSFLTLGIFWNGQQVQLQQLERSDRKLTWLHLWFLFSMTLMPFSTRLLSEFILYRPALLVYWANILLGGTWLYLTWRCAKGSSLLKPGVTGAVSKAVESRLLTAQALYAGGAALCLIDTRLSIGFIVIVQLNYVLAPGFSRSK